MSRRATKAAPAESAQTSPSDAETANATDAAAASNQYEGDYKSFVMRFGKAHDAVAGVRLFDVPGQVPWSGIMFGDGTKDAKPPQAVLDFLKQEPRFSFRADLGMWRRDVDAARPAQSRLAHQQKYEAASKMIREAKGLSPAESRSV